MDRHSRLRALNLAETVRFVTLLSLSGTQVSGQPVPRRITAVLNRSSIDAGPCREIPVASATMSTTVWTMPFFTPA